jgi:pilus assembly protein CpaB
LRPGNRAVSISVDATQSSSGLVLPGDRVDVILVQNLGETHGPSQKVVAETALRNIRIIAVDQSINAHKSASPEGSLFAEPRLPRTVTLELTEAQAQKLFVAMQLGALQLSVRPLELSETAERRDQAAATWAGDVSPALRQLSYKLPKSLPSGSTIESSIRVPPSLAF